MQRHHMREVVHIGLLDLSVAGFLSIRVAIPPLTVWRETERLAKPITLSHPIVSVQELVKGDCTDLAVSLETSKDTADLNRRFP